MIVAFNVFSEIQAKGEYLRPGASGCLLEILEFKNTTTVNRILLKTANFAIRSQISS